MATANFKTIKGLDYIYILRDEDLYAKNEEGDLDYDLLEEAYLTEIKLTLKELNASLEYHTISLLDGYYSGIQIDLQENKNLGDYELSDYDLLKDRRIAFYLMELLAIKHGFKAIKMISQASNGEAFYEYVK